jgi:hypothetical protein
LAAKALPTTNRGGDRLSAALKPRGIEAAIFCRAGRSEAAARDYPVGPGARIESAAPQAGNITVVARNPGAVLRAWSLTAWHFSSPGWRGRRLRRSRNDLETTGKAKWRFLQVSPRLLASR